MDLLTIILSSSSIGVVGLFIGYYICRRCRQSECTAHLQDIQGNHLDISMGTPHVEQRTNSNQHATPIEAHNKGPEIV